MSKYKNIATLLEKRIRYGDYFLKEIPSEREFASEINVSYMTVRRAFLELVNKGLLVRQPNKRLMVNKQQLGTNKLQIALLAPAYPTPYIEQWHLWLEELSVERNLFVRMIGYSHWDDTVITDTLEGFDGIFCLSAAEEIPEDVISQFKEFARPVVILGQDYSRQGIPSLRLTSPEMVQQLLDYVGSLNHQRIDCFNTQPMEETIHHRIEQWQLWLAANNREGRLINDPVKPFKSPMRYAYEKMKEMLSEGSYDATAIFCVTTAAAMGVMRAFQDEGYKVGQDISICSAEDGADVAPFLNPSLTCLKDRGRSRRCSCRCAPATSLQVCQLLCRSLKWRQAATAHPEQQRRASLAR
jgi:DNA-binding LacI/PurR family transcriptional regulator